MFLERLELTDFRNFADQQLELARPLTAFVGANAQGKTNLLEAIVLLALAHSPRCAHAGEMVRWGAQQAIVRGEIRRQRRDSISISVTLRHDGGKVVRVDGQPRAKVADAVGELAVVYFGPRDLRLVSGSPASRREFLNTCIGQAEPAYLSSLARYRGVLRQRNALLKTAAVRRVDEVLLLSLDDELAEAAAGMMSLRRRWVERLAEAAAAVHSHLSAGGERLEVRYRPNLRVDADPGPPRPDELDSADSANDAHVADPARLADSIREKLIAVRTEELRRGVTLVGPHRDDLSLQVDGKDARTFGSQGQQRTAALALKMAELRVMSETLGEPPILLLDDVLSELDAKRRAAVMELTSEAEQVLLAAATGDTIDIPELRQPAGSGPSADTIEVLRVERGTVKRDAA